MNCRPEMRKDYCPEFAPPDVWLKTFLYAASTQNDGNRLAQNLEVTP